MVGFAEAGRTGLNSTGAGALTVETVGKTTLSMQPNLSSHSPSPQVHCTRLFLQKNGDFFGGACGTANTPVYFYMKNIKHRGVASQCKAVEHWVQQTSRVFQDCLSLPNRRMLGYLSLGIAYAQSCKLSKVASKLCFLGSVPTVERRESYFLDNRQVDTQRAMMHLAQWVLRSVLAVKGRVTLLVDETALQEHLKVMVVALAYRKRALPLAWRCYPEEQYPMRQVDLVMRLLELVAPAIPKGSEVLIEADRGIGCSPELMERIQQKGWYYLFRVQGSVKLKLQDGREVSFREVVSHPGCCFNQELRALKNAGWRPCRAMGYWKVGQKEPWLLLTNHPEVSTKTYGARYWEEPAFRDFKSNGFNWQQSRVHEPDHAERLWLAIALAYVWVISLGTKVLEKIQWLHRVAHGASQRFSVFRLGIAQLERLLMLNEGIKEFLKGPQLKTEFLP